MKIGILSDLHGNFDATYSVLNLANQKGVSLLFILVIWLVTILKHKNLENF